jgi:hypothetical protein
MWKGVGRVDGQRVSVGKISREKYWRRLPARADSIHSYGGHECPPHGSWARDHSSSRLHVVKMDGQLGIWPTFDQKASWRRWDLAGSSVI